ncbi:hypothetical protein Tco_1472090 [Tanacetum coccineum]
MAKDTCLSLNPHLDLAFWYEHEIEVKERFEKKFVKSAETIQQRDAEIASLKSKLEKAEGEAMAVIRLHGRVSELEAATVARANELVDIGARNANSLVTFPDWSLFVMG